MKLPHLVAFFLVAGLTTGLAAAGDPSDFSCSLEKFKQCVRDRAASELYDFQHEQCSAMTATKLERDLTAVMGGESSCIVKHLQACADPAENPLRGVQAVETIKAEVAAQCIVDQCQLTLAADLCAAKVMTCMKQSVNLHQFFKKQLNDSHEDVIAYAEETIEHLMSVNPESDKQLDDICRPIRSNQSSYVQALLCMEHLQPPCKLDIRRQPTHDTPYHQLLALALQKVVFACSEGCVQLNLPAKARQLYACATRFRDLSDNFEGKDEKEQCSAVQRYLACVKSATGGCAYLTRKLHFMLQPNPALDVPLIPANCSSKPEIMALRQELEQLDVSAESAVYNATRPPHDAPYHPDDPTLAPDVRPGPPPGSAALLAAQMSLLSVCVLIASAA